MTLMEISTFGGAAERSLMWMKKEKTMSTPDCFAITPAGGGQWLSYRTVPNRTKASQIEQKIILLWRRWLSSRRRRTMKNHAKPYKVVQISHNLYQIWQMREECLIVKRKGFTIVLGSPFLIYFLYLEINSSTSGMPP